MGELAALDEEEAAFWRSLIRITTVLPRALEDQFLPETGLTNTDYGVLVALSEAPDHLLLQCAHMGRQQAVEVKRVALALRERRTLVQKGVAEEVEPCDVDLDCIL